MPIYYERHDAARRLVIISSGQVTFEEVRDTLDRQASEGIWSYAALWDARKALTDPTIDELRRMVLHVGALTASCGPRGQVAIVTSSESFARMGRVYAGLGHLTALRVQVFDTLEHAEAWLDQE
jgi:hypothetical protein